MIALGSSTLQNSDGFKKTMFPTVKNNNSTIHLMRQLWLYISPRRKTQFSILIFFMFLVSLMEMASLGSIFPFLKALTAPHVLFESVWIQPFIHFFAIDNPDQLLLPALTIFLVVSLLTACSRMGLLFLSTKYAFSVGLDLSAVMYANLLNLPYESQIKITTGEKINTILNKSSNIIYGVINPIMILISSTLILLTVLIILIAMDPVVAITAMGGFGFIYLLVIRLTRRQLLLNSHRISTHSTNVYQSLQEGFGGVRDVIIDNLQEFYTQVFKTEDAHLKAAQAASAFINGVPRYAIESLAMSLIACLAYWQADKDIGIIASLPFLGALAIGAQRMLPLFQQSYGAWTSILGSHSSLEDCLRVLDMQNIRENVLPQAITGMKRSIEFKEVFFHYDSDPLWIFKGLNIAIASGSRVGIIGPTGCGKSTLFDLMMGLLTPVKGEIYVDGTKLCESNKKSWQSKIAHVPQDIFLINGTIIQNIAFGIPPQEVDMGRVIYAAEKAMLKDVINRWPNGYGTLVGERGSQLSGGERQRIGIARALYKKANIIFFDESTSALDSKTESEIMNTLDALPDNCTVIVIAHRVSTLKNCDTIIELGGNGITRVGSYGEIINEH